MRWHGRCYSWLSTIRKGHSLFDPAESLEHARAVATKAGFLDESGRIPFADSDVYRIIKTGGTDFRILDLLVPKRLDTIAWEQRQCYDWNGLPICTVSLEGLVEMKRAAGRDIDLIDIKDLDLIPMSKIEAIRPKPKRDFEVNMSSEAITSRLREVGELNQLGLSLARAKPCPTPQSQTIEATRYSERPDLFHCSSCEVLSPPTSEPKTL